MWRRSTRCRRPGRPARACARKPQRPSLRFRAQSNLLVWSNVLPRGRHAADRRFEKLGSNRQDPPRALSGRGSREGVGERPPRSNAQPTPIAHKARRAHAPHEAQPCAGDHQSDALPRQGSSPTRCPPTDASGALCASSLAEQPPADWDRIDYATPLRRRSAGREPAARKPRTTAGSTGCACGLGQAAWAHALPPLAARARRPRRGGGGGARSGRQPGAEGAWPLSLPSNLRAGGALPPRQPPATSHQPPRAGASSRRSA